MKREANKTCRCNLCGDAFETVREDAKYCSPACRQLAYRVSHGKSIVIRSRRLVGRHRDIAERLYDSR